ncbi:MAG: hypothetical protein R2711_01115 [Acidimicrobiales bacterium]
MTRTPPVALVVSSITCWRRWPWPRPPLAPVRVVRGDEPAALVRRPSAPVGLHAPLAERMIRLELDFVHGPSGELQMA